MKWFRRARNREPEMSTKPFSEMTDAELRHEWHCSQAADLPFGYAIRLVLGLLHERVRRLEAKQDSDAEEFEP